MLLGGQKNGLRTADNTTYTLRANALALQDIAPFGRNLVYAGNVISLCDQERAL